MDFRQIFSLVTGLLSGLALFLFGMDTMSGALSRMAGGRLERVISTLTKNRYTGFLFGTAITAVVQSSSAVTVLTVGLVNSGIMELRKAAGLIIGANLGTTATAWILSLNALSGQSFLMELFKPSSFTPFLGIAGVAMLMFARTGKAKNIGSALIGFAVMMIGMGIMGGATAPLKNIPSFTGILTSFENPFVGFLFALVFTMIIQSSDATVGMLQALSISIGVNFGMAIPLVCGAQVGTCVTALLSSLDASNNGKRTALVQLYYNLLKTIPFLVGFYALDWVFHFSFTQEDVGVIGIPAFHSLINCAAALVYLPMSGMIVRLAEKTIPYSEEEKQEKRDTLTILNPQLLVSPNFALEQVKESIKIMAKTVQKAYSALTDSPDAEGDSSEVLCGRVRKYRTQIVKYLAEILNAGVQGADLRTALSSQTYCEAFGRMGELISDHLALRTEADKVPQGFSQEARSDLRLLKEAVGEVVDCTAAGYAMEKRSFSETITVFREAVSSLHNEVIVRHIKRLHSGVCSKVAGPYFLDMCYSLEKLIDNCDTIAEEAIEHDSEAHGFSSEYSSKRRKILRLFNDKYRMLLEE